MAAKQEEIVKALKIAIQMELDGREFYLKSARTSTNPFGKILFESLARAEDEHIKRFEEIFLAFGNKEGWPAIIHVSNENKLPNNLFSLANKKLDRTHKVTKSELEAAQLAIEMENKSYDFYLQQQQQTTYHLAHDYYKALAAEERGHFLLLLEYQEYLTNPTDYFIEMEHHSLDGG